MGGFPLYPLKFSYILKEKVWGGRRLETLLGKRLPEGSPIGESWEVSDHGEDTTVVAEGALAGRSLHELAEQFPEELMGNKGMGTAAGCFPLLLKFIDASDVLSVQVHPDDDYAAKHEGKGELGKTEAWYVLDADEGARLVRGVKPGTTRDEFAELLKEGRLEECLNTFEVKAGDVLYLPAGMLHALGAGVVVAEIQQNSDTTYRVYDWNRVGLDGKPRELHVEKALEVIDFGVPLRNKEVPMLLDGYPYRRENLVRCAKFAMESIETGERITEERDGEAFAILCFVEGGGWLEGDFESVEVKVGDSVLVPAGVRRFAFAPGEDSKFLLMQVP